VQSAITHISAETRGAHKHAGGSLYALHLKL
jgi:hypothetical protein